MGRTRRWDFNADLHFEVSVRVHCRGYFDPGCWYDKNGDPGYPPEGDDEREIIAVEVNEKPVPPALLAAWCDLLDSYVAETDIEIEEPEEEE